MNSPSPLATSIAQRQQLNTALVYLGCLFLLFIHEASPHTPSLRPICAFHPRPFYPALPPDPPPLTLPLSQRYPQPMYIWYGKIFTILFRYPHSIIIYVLDEPGESYLLLAQSASSSGKEVEWCHRDRTPARSTPSFRPHKKRVGPKFTYLPKTKGTKIIATWMISATEKNI